MTPVAPRLIEVCRKLRGCLTDYGDHEIVDLHLIKIPVNRANAEVLRPELERALREDWPTEAWGHPMPALKDGPSYIHIGGALDSQQLALELMAVGKVLGLWGIMDPPSMGFRDPEQVQEMVGIGYLFIKDYAG